MGTGSAYVVIAVEQNQQDADGGGKHTQPALREDIRVQQTPTVADADFVLFLLVDAIERGEVDVGGRLVDVGVLVRCAEDARERGVSEDISLTR